MTAELNKTTEDDGVFFMEISDFVNYYSSCCVCYYEDNYEYAVVKTTCKNDDPVYFLMSVGTEGDHYITVNQESKRH